MIRTVVAGSPGRLLSSSDGDGYLAKLVKYVPVEGLAPFLPIAAFASGDVQRWAVFAISLVVGVVLILAQSRSNNETPPVWYWPFVIIAFCAWSVGASEAFRDVLGVSDQLGALVLALTATALPALDSALEKIIGD